MVTLGKRAQTLETSANPKKMTKTTEEISGYEQCREQRIKENMERMQKLGILDLSLKLKSEVLQPKRTPRTLTERKTPKPKGSSSSLLSLQTPRRRSSRLQKVTPVSYSELRPYKRVESEDENVRDFVGEGSKPEMYTEEHEKLLGDCENSWDLFVDGCGKDGKRIYDPVKGKTCHQCRQKTLGHRTHCSQCNLLQGQFCGDCLYMRYGENVLEANQNPNWICPVCRGICNCSFCRQAKGWPPTGTMYRKVVSLGFKSVAHYLIQTRHSETGDKEEEQDAKTPPSARKSLTFANTEESSQQKETPNSDENSKALPEDGNGDGPIGENTKSEISLSDDENPKPLSENSANGDLIKGEDAESEIFPSKHEVVDVDSVDDVKLAMEPVAPIRTPDSIAGRLRQRRSRC